MKEDTEKERLEQLEQEEIEKQKRMSRRSSSPVMRSPRHEAEPREAQSEPLPRITPFVSFLASFASARLKLELESLLKFCCPLGCNIVARTFHLD